MTDRKITKEFRVVKGVIVTGHVNRHGAFVDVRPAEVDVISADRVCLYPSSWKDGPAPVKVPAQPIKSRINPAYFQSDQEVTAVSFNFQGHNFTKKCSQRGSETAESLEAWNRYREQVEARCRARRAQELAERNKYIADFYGHAPDFLSQLSEHGLIINKKYLFIQNVPL